MTDNANFAEFAHDGQRALNDNKLVIAHVLKSTLIKKKLLSYFPVTICQTNEHGFSFVKFCSVFFFFFFLLFGPRQANLVLIAYASSEGSGEPAHPRSLARTFAARSYKQWIKRNLQTESQIPGPSEWLGMRSWNLSWRNARRHKFAWRGPFSKHMIKRVDESDKLFIMQCVRCALMIIKSFFIPVHTILPNWHKTHHLA